MTFAQPFHDYELLDRVGAGAMGTVFKARHKRLNRIVALKVLKPSLARDARYVDRLRREARIVASLNHPFIVTGYDLGEEGGYHYFVMEFVEGKSLRALLVEWGMFAEEYVQRVARQTAQALDHAYQRGVIHRDIKPGNILIDESGNVKLTDMGLAKGPADLTLTRDGATVGTPQYISPEQARNPHDVDVRTDLYSLGATLYHMAAGVPPFGGDTMAELITNVLHETPVPPNEHNPALSEGMSLVIRKLLAKDLTIRYQTPRELLDDLDRIERALPPQIDAARLSVEAGDLVRWWPRTLVAIGVVVLLGAAWWLGVQSRANPDSEPTASEFLATLDAELQTLPTPGARLARLRTITSSPVGSAHELQQRERAVMVDLQSAVERIVDRVSSGPGWDELVAWTRNPAVWPDRARVERERLQPELVDRAGVALGQLRPSVRLQRLDDLLAAIDQSLIARDHELVLRFEQFLATTIAARADERVRASDFAGAERVWLDALTTFCDGVRLPLPERVAEATRRALQEKRLAPQKAAMEQMEAAEGEVADALRAEVEAVCGHFMEQLDAGEAPDNADASLQRYRQDRLPQVWPPPGHFRSGHDPWPDLERRFGEVQQAISLASLRREANRLDRRFDLVWRAFCAGRAADALQLLPENVPDALRATRGTEPARHKTALVAARAVEQALLGAIERSNQPTIGFLRGGGAEPIELRVERAGGSVRLVGTGADQTPRAMRLYELRFDDLLRRVGAERDPLAAVPPEQRTLGVALARLAGGDFDGIGAVVATLSESDRTFVLDDVWPRIQRVRDERPDTPLDRASLFARLRQLRQEAEQRPGALRELQQALLACSQLPEAERTTGEDRELRAIRQWLQLALRRRDVDADLAKAAPRGADVAVSIEGDEIVAQVAMPADVLQRDAAGGWQLRGDTLEFAGNRPWSERAQQVLEGNPGIEPVALHTSMTIQFVLPPTSVGRRFWVFEFRGIACVVVLGTNDTVHAALIEGDGRREAHQVDRAFQHAIDRIATGKIVALPGAEHRLTIDVTASSTGTRAMVRVSFEGAELLAEPHRLDPHQPPSFAVHPQQEIAVRKVVVRASGF